MLYSYMKKIYILVFLLIGLGHSNAQWFEQNYGAFATFKDVYFSNENTGWVCGWGKVLKTTNGGTNWTSYTLGNHSYNSICFTNNNTGFVCGDGGSVYKTTDAGSSWNLIDAGSTNNLMKIRFVNQNIGLIAGFHRTILKTINGGTNWVSVIANDTLPDMLGIKMLDVSTYFVTGVGSHIYRTNNGGTSWDTMSFNMVKPLWAPEFINNNTGWVTGCCGMYVKTTN